MSGVSNTERLRSLLNAAKEDQELTVDEIAKRTQGRIRRSRAANLTTDVYRAKPLTRQELEDIAVGFGVDFEVLRLAHLADMDLLGEDDDAPAIVPLASSTEIDRLTRRQRSAVVAVVRAMIDPDPISPEERGVLAAMDLRHDEIEAATPKEPTAPEVGAPKAGPAPARRRRGRS